MGSFFLFILYFILRPQYKQPSIKILVITVNFNGAEGHALRIFQFFLALKWKVMLSCRLKGGTDFNIRTVKFSALRPSCTWLQRNFWYSFLLQAEWTSGLLHAYRNTKSLKNFQGPYRESKLGPLFVWCSASIAAPFAPTPEFQR